MQGPFEAVPLSERVYWVGAVDWALRNFHGYATPGGSTYNAFLVLGKEKIVLVDTVKKAFQGELLSRVASVVDPGKIDVIVSNHAEMDHSGCLPEVAALVKPETILASKTGVQALAEHFGPELAVRAVEDGEVLDLGGVTLRFAETRMLHWPESMVTWCPEERILFAQDIFGSHLATCERFDDQVDPHVLDWEAAKYFANILMPYSVIVAKGVEKLLSLGVEWKILATDHGPLWRSRIPEILENYRKWSLQKPSRKAVIVYDTMWGSTELMARAVAEGISRGGASPKLMPLGGSHRSDVATEVLLAGALLVGAPTINAGMYPSLADTLTYLQSLKPKNLVGAVFGSYGWGPVGIKQAHANLTVMGVESVAEPLAVKFVPKAEDLEACRKLGLQVAEAVLSRL